MFGKRAKPPRDIASEVIGPNPFTSTITWGRRVFHVTEKNGRFVATDGHYQFEGNTLADLRADAIRGLAAVARLREEYGLEP